MPERRVTLDVAGLAMDVFAADPDGAGPHPGVVVIMHAPGLDAFTEEMARRLAGEGYAAIAPQLYHRQDLTTDETGLERMAKLRDEELIADVRRLRRAFPGAERPHRRHRHHRVLHGRAHHLPGGDGDPRLPRCGPPSTAATWTWGGATAPR